MGGITVFDPMDGCPIEPSSETRRLPKKFSWLNDYVILKFDGTLYEKDVIKNHNNGFLTIKKRVI